MVDMSNIPGTPGWVKSKGGSSIKPVEKVTVTEQDKSTPVEVKADTKVSE